MGRFAVFFAFALTACGPASSNHGGPDGGDGQVLCEPGATQSCYTGSSGTEGVGVCVAGTQTCGQAGLWESCIGAVTPLAEVCANGADDDCDGTVDEDPDLDGDGWTACGGDCCETTQMCGDPTRVNPAAAEAPTAMGGIPVDDNCNGMIDEVSPPCDGALQLTSPDPLDAARAIGLCHAATSSTDSGLVSVKFTRANGTDFAPGAQVGIHEQWGTNVVPKEGTQLWALSSGRARLPGDPGACGGLTCANNNDGVAPNGFPQDPPDCPVSSEINDDVALELHLKAPANAVGFSIDFAFYSFEYPEWVCTDFNDQFVILMNPAPAGSINGNIAFDSQSNPVSVNAGFFQVCEGCALGTADLAGTGFDTWDDAGGTGWLRSTAPVTPNEEFTVRLMIWDTGDQAWDSTTIVDNFQWILEGSVGVDTTPIF